jgi:sulfopyruvate decarboxylase alpha subunit
VQQQAWHEVVQSTLKANDVKFVTYVPDRVLTPLIAGLSSDPVFKTVVVTREEEAVGISAGAWMAGCRNAILMQTSGFATLPNALASLTVPFQIPTIMFVSERGTMGEFNIGQVHVCRTMRPVAEALGMETHTITKINELEFTVDRGINQAFATRAPVLFILSPLLTGGKKFAA